MPEVVPALIRAATAGQEPDEKYVRFAAIKGLAVFAGNLKPGDSKLRAEIEPVMLKASSDDEPLVRSTAAFALGALGGDKAIERLKQLLVDANPNVRLTPPRCWPATARWLPSRCCWKCLISNPPLEWILKTKRNCASRSARRF